MGFVLSSWVVSTAAFLMTMRARIRRLVARRWCLFIRVVLALDWGLVDLRRVGRRVRGSTALVVIWRRDEQGV